jgi:serine/threonine-protein kinase
MTARPDPRLGTDLGPYRIEAVLGRGGMGVVYLAEQTRLGRKVALKIVAPEYSDDTRLRARFIRESKMAAAIDHPNILPIYEADEAEGVLFIAMRLVEGADLVSRLRDGPLAPRETVHLLAQVGAALDAAHARGLIHRDVKPANVLIAPGAGVDSADHAYLADFGLTKRGGSESSLTAVGAFAGTLAYIAPEQVEGREVEGRADQYSLACLAFECLTGRVPFERDSDIAVAMAHLRDAPPSAVTLRPELPAAVDAVLARGMAKASADRYATCAAFMGALRGALDISATAPRPIPVAAARRSRRIPLAIGATTVLLIAIAGVLLGVGAFGPGATPSPSPSEVAVASSTPNASATLGAFPSDAEAALLHALPADLSEVCQRGSYKAMDAGFGQGHPLASLSCKLPAGTGANEIDIWRFRFLGTLAGNSGFTTESFISIIAGPKNIPGGDCRVSPRANGRWELSGEDAGAIICYHDAATGDAILYWTYKDYAILVEATNSRGDSAALYAYFRQVAPFISP